MQPKLGLLSNKRLPSLGALSACIQAFCGKPISVRIGYLTEKAIFSLQSSCRFKCTAPPFNKSYTPLTLLGNSSTLRSILEKEYIMQDIYRLHFCCLRDSILLTTYFNCREISIFAAIAVRLSSTGMLAYYNGYLASVLYIWFLRLIATSMQPPISMLLPLVLEATV
jgi:hypothetical protein